MRARRRSRPRPARPAPAPAAPARRARGVVRPRREVAGPGTGGPRAGSTSACARGRRGLGELGDPHSSATSLTLDSATAQYGRHRLGSDTIQGDDHDRTGSPTPTTGRSRSSSSGCGSTSPWRLERRRPGAPRDAADDRRARAEQGRRRQGRGGVAGLPGQPVDGRPHRHHDDPVVAQHRGHLLLRRSPDHQHRRHGSILPAAPSRRRGRSPSGTRRTPWRPVAPRASTRPQPYGLGAVAGVVPVARRGESARDRIGRRGILTRRRA